MADSLLEYWYIPAITLLLIVGFLQVVRWAKRSADRFMAFRHAMEAQGFETSGNGVRITFRRKLGPLEVELAPHEIVKAESYSIGHRWLICGPGDESERFLLHWPRFESRARKDPFGLRKVRLSSDVLAQAFDAYVPGEEEAGIWNNPEMLKNLEKCLGKNGSARPDLVEVGYAQGQVEIIMSTGLMNLELACASLNVGLILLNHPERFEAELGNGQG